MGEMPTVFFLMICSDVHLREYPAEGTQIPAAQAVDALQFCTSP